MKEYQDTMVVKSEKESEKVGGAGGSEGGPKKDQKVRESGKAGPGVEALAAAAAAVKPHPERIARKFLGIEIVACPHKKSLTDLQKHAKKSIFLLTRYKDYLS